jgi:hypothetical protein
MTGPQTTAANNLQTAIDAALAVGDSGDGNYHRLLVEKLAGSLGAIEILEPNWTGYKTEADGVISWSAAHPSH